MWPAWRVRVLAAASHGKELELQFFDAKTLSPQGAVKRWPLPEGFGYAMALGELAVGIGTLVGLLARLAALGGALISLSLWLTVSWQTAPYYYGNDLAYLMAWLPLVLAGASLFSLDALIAARRRRIP